MSLHDDVYAKRQGLRDILAAAFASNDLPELLDFQMDVTPYPVPHGGAVPAEVYELIQWARREGRLVDLVCAAQKARPSNPDLKQFIAQFPGLCNPTASASPSTGGSSAGSAPVITPETITKIQNILFPIFNGDAGSRQAVLFTTLTNTSVLNQIEYSGPTGTFVSRLIQTLLGYGKVDANRTALWALLEGVRGQVGYDKQQEIDQLKPFVNG